MIKKVTLFHFINIWINYTASATQEIKKRKKNEPIAELKKKPFQ